MQNDDQDKRETPFGTFYRPRSIALQMMTLLGALLGILLIGWLISQALGGVSKNAQIFLFIPFFLILVLGYGLWLSRLEALAFEIIGKGILRALYEVIVKRKKPESPESILPPKEKLEEMAVRAQRAASSFFIVAIPAAIGAGLAALFIESPTGVWLRICVISGGCLLWGRFLTNLGRRGYLPLPEEG